MEPNESPPRRRGQDGTRPRLLKAYYEEFGSAYLRRDVFARYPETTFIPGYIARNFGDARLVLDLGFGTGLWFWASFLPALERLDGIDGHPEALAEADKVFQASRLPEGFRAAHARIGQAYGMRDLRRLETKRGHLVFQDYRHPWPDVLLGTRYDLVTEHGGGLGTMRSDDEFAGVVQQVAAVLKPSGCLLFVNFALEPSALERHLGKVASPGFRLREELFVQAAEQAGLHMVDFHAIDEPEEMAGIRQLFYGYAQK